MKKILLLAALFGAVTVNAQEKKGGRSNESEHRQT
jgi:hypothetical protein